MAKGSSGGSYSSGYSGKGAYSGSLGAKGYGAGNSMGYSGSTVKGYGRDGLASRLSGYFTKSYSLVSDKPSLSSRLNSYQMKGLQDKLYSDRESLRIIRELLKEKPHYFEKAYDPNERIERCPFCGGMLGKCACRN